ncbi:MAG: vanadium-dependent haloperoxidase, partial [Candidatus Eremiobacteraeota bacterium]|nr:vanadium-dependent haloperoxidase [Candidatus Eremiobacteraeota bacterium]
AAPQKIWIPTTNGDEDRYAHKRARFAKPFPHDVLGEVDPQAYRDWLSILADGDPAQFERVPRDSRAVAKLNDPQATYAFDLVGVDSHATRLAPPPTFASDAMAVEMAELYWQALTIDVPFRDYETNALVAAAVTDLNAFSHRLGSPPAGKIEIGGLFRGETAGDLIGPYVSQFLWLDVPYGLKVFDQRYRFPNRNQAFLTEFTEWLACQRGAEAAVKLQFEAEPRYICSNRELAEYVHQNFSFQTYLNAALIMLRFGHEALSPTNPYLGSRTQFGDITLGNKNILSLIAEASLIGQKGAYYHKWLVHRRLRPECFSGRIEVHVSGRMSYDVHPEILKCDGVARTKAVHGSSLLPIAFPEGCPTHPSYPSAHATNAGACATILKAFFNEDYPIPYPIEAMSDGRELVPWKGEPLTLGNEINKLANNIALGRDAAGVHYRSDSINGLFVGEQQALGLLCDYSRTYNERFDGFGLSTLSGEKVRIVNGELKPM